MQTTATVIELRDDRAIIEVERESACEGCHKSRDGKGCSICSLTGANKKFRATAINRIGAEVGERVLVSSDTSKVLGYSAIVFLLPLVVGFAFYFLSELVTQIEWIRCAALLSGFLLAFLGVFGYSKAVAKKRCDLEIVARACEIVQTEERA